MPRSHIFSFSSHLARISSLAICLLAASIASAQTNEVEPLSGPATARGFAADRTFQFGAVDNVNLYSGNLSVQVPIGPSYPVSPQLSYGLVLSYNAASWRFNWVYDDLEGWIRISYPATYERGTAGIGWTLSMGRLWMTGTTNQSSPGHVVYMSEDGGRHEFFPKLHDGDTDDPGDSFGTQNTLYTRDGSYLRLTKAATGVLNVEFPNGVTKSFVRVGGGAGEYLLYDIQDSYGNYVAIQYLPSLAAWTQWRITDSHGRIHDVYFTNTASTEFPKVPNRAELEAFDDDPGDGVDPKAVWTFTHSYRETQRACQNWASGAELQNVPFLDKIALPDASTYDLTYVEPAIPPTFCFETPGYLESMTLPTKGKLVWEYDEYHLPGSREGDPGSPQEWEVVYGVSKRHFKDRNDTVLGTWTYTQALGSLCNDSYVDTTTTVTDPLGHYTEHYFSGLLPGESGCSASSLDYGLPFSPRSTLADPVSGLFLSQRFYDSGGTLQRSRYVEYERDEETPLLEHKYATQLNRRLEKERIVYETDGDRYAETIYSDFDGLGHYRTATTAGDFAAGNVRTSTTNFNPGAGTYPGSFTIPASTSPWVLGTYAERTTIEGGTTYKEQFCFDAANGFLKRRRMQAGSTRQAKDVIAQYVADADGQVEFERYFGGDKQAVGTGSNLCNLTLPSANVYEIEHNYTSGYGSRRWSRYNKATGAGIGFKFLDQDIDLSTGLPTTSRDSAGLATTYNYDTLGRITLLQPATGHGAQVTYDYTKATTTGLARVDIKQKSNDGATTLSESRLVFDDLARLSRERKKLPSGSWSSRDTSYNARGWKDKVSVTWTGTPSVFTVFSDYDPFGRPGTVTPPDGTNHNLTTTYTGVSKIQRTVPIATGGGETAQTTTEEYDRQGRLYKVTEPTGTTTTYGYDPAGRLASVAMTGGGTTQTRAFNYDGRGFLLSESHPEKTAAVTYSSYDARGHTTRKIDGPSDLTFTFDRAERLTQVKETSGIVLKTFQYAAANNGNDLRQGKLWKAIRYNLLPGIYSAPNVDIEEVYIYAGKDGRVSQRDTKRYGNVWFSQTFTWDELGNPASTGYPSCTRTGCGSIAGRTATYGYTQGFLTSVPGYASSLTYHGNRTLSQVVHTNGVTDVWEADPNKMQRPYRIRTTGSTDTNFDTNYFAYDGAGNVSAIGSDTYHYDGVSRLLSGTAQGGAVSESNSYDPFGNRVSVTSGGLTRSTAADPATNRLTGSTGRPVAYDAAGNQTEWGTVTYTYDQLHMPVRYKDGAEDLSYVYTADDERIAIVVADTTDQNRAESAHWMLRDLSGQALRTFDELDNGGFTFYWNKDYVRGDGRLLARASAAGLQHAHVDHLGSPRLWTRGNKSAVVRYDYLPFGELVAQSVEAEPLKYTGHERDDHLSGGCGSGTEIVNGQELASGETKVGCDAVTSENTTVTSTTEVKFVAGQRIELGEGFNVTNGAVFTAEVDGDLKNTRQDLDYMRARYCSPYLGRFASVDPVLKLGQAMKRPQRWNRYAYVANNPMKWVDRTGEYIQLPEDCTDGDCEELSVLQLELDRAGSEVELEVGADGVIEAIGADLENSDNQTISLLAGLINDKTNGVDFAFTSQDLSKDAGAVIAGISENLVQIRINPQQVRQNIFTGVGLSGMFSGSTIGGIGTLGPAAIHELGHAAAYFGGFPFNEFRTRATSNEWALRYENFHRSLLSGPENFRRLYHDEKQLWQ